MARAAAPVPGLVAVLPARGGGGGSKNASPGYDADDGGAGDDAQTFAGESGTLGNTDGIATCTGPRCSSDLHSLVDCQGKVLMTCPPDQGCAGNGCAPACDAATANKS